MSLIGKIFETMSTTYTVTGVLGEGGSGQVLAVTDDKGLPYALKSLAPERVTTEKVKRFRNELSFCQRNIHPGIVRVFDFGFTNVKGAKVPFYVMPIYKHTLRNHIDAKLSPPIALETFVRILDAVEAAHYCDVWHRDLKPENILSNDDPRDLVIADFGIAHFCAELLKTSVVTRKCSKLFNQSYAAPEQLQRGATVDRRADIFALGLILNELFTGKVPHGTDHLTVASIAPELGYLDALVDHMLRQAPEGRPSQISDIKAQLIGRRNEYVAQQKLDETRKIVVPVSVPATVPDISFVSFDYQDDRLLIKLEPVPPQGWMQFFNDPPGGHSAIMGYGPEKFNLLKGGILSISVPEKYVRVIVNHAREYAQKASSGLRTHLAKEAKKKEQMENERLRKEIEKAETRLRVLAQLNKEKVP